MGPRVKWSWEWWGGVGRQVFKFFLFRPLPPISPISATVSALWGFAEAQGGARESGGEREPFASGEEETTTPFPTSFLLPFWHFFRDLVCLFALCAFWKRRPSSFFLRPQVERGGGRGGGENFFFSFPRKVTRPKGASRRMGRDSTKFRRKPTNTST